MGRAKGTRNNRAGEPAPGRGVWPSALDELQEIGGMSPAWHARNHLVQDALGEVDVDMALSSPFFPESLPHELGRLPISSATRIRLFSEALVPRGMLLTSKDPVVRAILKSEWERVADEKWAAEYAKDPESKQRLFEIWEREILEGMPEIAGREGSAPTDPRWWDSPETGQKRLRLVPSGLLAAAFLDKGRDWLASVLDEAEPDWVRENILPEVSFFAGRSAHHSSWQRDERFLQSLWRSLSRMYPPVEEIDIEGHHGRLATIIQKGGDLSAPRFLETPIPDSNGWHSLFHGVFREYPFGSEEPSIDEMADLAEKVLAQQIVGLYLKTMPPRAAATVRSPLLTRSSLKSNQWQEFRKDGKVFPLDSLRDLFVGEGEEELFESLRSEIISSLPDIDNSIYIDNAIRDHFVLREAIEISHSEAIARAIRRYFATLRN